jgi:site-specific recombinase XerD
VISDRRSVADGTLDPPRVGTVIASAARQGVRVLDAEGREIAPIEQYLRHLMLCDMSVLTCRSYAFDLLRWFRLMWCLETPWNASTPADAEVLVSWMRNTSNYQRGRNAPDTSRPGSVNPKTGKPSLSSGFAPRTINHALSVVHQFYEFHSSLGDGPVVNPVPGTTANWWDTNGSESFRSTLQYPHRGRLRQKVPRTLPRAIPDNLWDELFLSMNCTRDRALLSLYISSGARASELLTLQLGDVDWSRQVLHVIGKGSKEKQSVPVSPEGLRYLALYLAEDGTPAPDEPLWRTRRGVPRALTYSAARRVLQRANEKIATNWTLHDLRHTAATRLANDPSFALTDVQAILRHADISTTAIYTAVRVDDLFDQLQAHYDRPQRPKTYAPGYDEQDASVVFGA